MSRAPRTATSMTALPMRSSIIVKPAARCVGECLRVLTVLAPSSREELVDPRPGPESAHLPDQRARADDVDVLGRINEDLDPEGVLILGEEGDSPVVALAVHVES